MGGRTGPEPYPRSAGKAVWIGRWGVPKLFAHEEPFYYCTARPGPEGSGAMTRSALALLELRHLPLRLTAGQTGTCMGLTVDEVRLVASAEVLRRLIEQAPPALRRRLLPPSQRLQALGSPAKQAVKFYATCEVLSRAQDVEWLDRAHRTLHAYWKSKAARKRAKPTPK